MADKKTDKKEKEAGESIVAKQFAEKQEPATTTTTKPSDIKEINHGHGSILYHYGGKGYKTMEEAQKAKEAREGSTTDVKNASTGDSPIAQQFAEPTKKDKTWADVKEENGNDPAKIADYLNNTPDYKSGDLTKKGMAEMGYKQGEDGKWSTSTTNAANTETETETKSKVTNDEVLDRLDELAAENEALRKLIESLTNKETGVVDEGKVKAAMQKLEQKMVEQGAGDFDIDGNFHMKNVNTKGWEDWATMLSAGLSVLGLAMGIPIIPINFRKITGKDARDREIRRLQKQYTDILGTNAAKVADVESSIIAGNLAGKNKDAIKNYSDYTENVGAYGSKKSIDTDSEKELIETRTDAQIRADEAAHKRNLQLIGEQQDFELKLEALRETYKEQFAALESALTTGSAKELLKYQNGEMFKEMKEMGITPSMLGSYVSAKNGITPADKNWNRVKMGVDMVTGVADSASNFIGGKGKKK